MIKAIALAGATAALVVGSLAVAQTATDNNANPPASATAPNTNNYGAANNPNGTAANNPNGTAADNAGQAGVNTSATGERG